MMMTTQPELLKDCHQEWLVMEAAYWEGAVENSKRPANVWDYDTYYLMESMGKVKIYTARLPDGKLIGFDLYFIIPALHHQGHTVAMCDSLATAKDFRGKGIAKSLMIYAEHELRKFVPKISWITHNAKCNRTNNPLFPSLGYEADETVYIKRM